MMLRLWYRLTVYDVWLALSDTRMSDWHAMVTRDKGNNNVMKHYLYMYNLHVVRYTQTENTNKTLRNLLGPPQTRVKKQETRNKTV